MRDRGPHLVRRAFKVRNENRKLTSLQDIQPENVFRETLVGYWNELLSSKI
jgi:hypothetical protein